VAKRKNEEAEVVTLSMAPTIEPQVTVPSLTPQLTPSGQDHRIDETAMNEKRILMVNVPQGAGMVWLAQDACRADIITSMSLCLNAIACLVMIIMFGDDNKEKQECVFAEKWRQGRACSGGDDG
jgi:hypothetical protein